MGYLHTEHIFDWQPIFLSLWLYYLQIVHFVIINRETSLRAATDESQKTRNKKQNGLAHSRFIVCVTPKQKKNIAWFENQVLAEHVRKSQSTIYLKSHGCVHGFQNEVSLINFSTMFCKPCSLSRNRSLRDAKSARHMFVWFAKHCLAEHCLLFRGDADECQKQFCFVFRICLAFFYFVCGGPKGAFTNQSGGPYSKLKLLLVS